MRRLLVSSVVTAIALAAAAPAGAVSTSPVYAGDFPDPFVLVANGTYWAYSTGSDGRNLQVTSSSDLTTWAPLGDPLPVLPGWAEPGYTWAPGVASFGGRFVMYYTVRHAASGRQCISVATSSGPAGPFADDSSGPLVCQVADGGSIDPSPVVTPAGSFLVWKSDESAIGRPAHIWAQPLSADGRSLVGLPSVLLSQSQSWHMPRLEGPSMIVRNGVYYLFYGAGDWASSTAAIGWAACLTPLGPCFESSASPWMKSHGEAVGPSGPALFVDAAGGTRIAYHAWTGSVGYDNGGARSLWVDGVRFNLGGPVLT